MRARTEFIVVAGLGLALVAGCPSPLECGEGTFESNGKCVSLLTLPLPNSCGTGTRFDPVSGTCECTLVAEDWGACGEFTTRLVDDEGLPVCVGQAACGCDTRPPCPPPSSSLNVRICGRIYDLETSAPVATDPDDAGPASRFVVSLYDPIAFINDPDSAVVIATPTIDNCGYFEADVELPYSDKIGATVDDAGAADDYVRTGVATEATRGTSFVLNAFATRRTTDEAWTAALGNPFGTDPSGGDRTASQVGVYVPIYIDGAHPELAPPGGLFEGPPVAGVKIVRGSTQPAYDYYFTDTDPLGRAGISADLDATGADGTGLLWSFPGIDSGYTGEGPAGCTWPTYQGGMVPGVVFVHVRTGECP